MSTLHSQPHSRFTPIPHISPLDSFLHPYLTPVCLYPTENPCPHLGNIVTIKLSEGEETVAQPDGPVLTMLAETHFQMNYNTGEWKRIKKYRPLPPE